MPVTHLFISPSPRLWYSPGQTGVFNDFPPASSFPMMSTQSKVMNPETSNDASSRVRQLPTRSLACSVITGDPWAWGPRRKDGRLGRLLFLELNLKSSHLRVSCYSNPHPHPLTSTNCPFFQFCFKCCQLPEAFPDVFGLIRDLKSPYQDFLSLAFY